MLNCEQEGIVQHIRDEEKEVKMDIETRRNFQALSGIRLEENENEAAQERKSADAWRVREAKGSVILTRDCRG